jgi:hypothetical protein
MTSREAIYPVIIPNGWHLIDPDGGRIDLRPSLAEPFQRLRAFGAVSAAAPGVDDRRARDGLLLNIMPDPGPWNEERLDQYGDALLAPQRYPQLKARCDKRLLQLVFSRDPSAKIMLSFFDAFSGQLERVSIYYFVRNVDEHCWSLQYFIDANKYAWLLAVLEREIERDPIDVARDPRRTTH